MFGPSAARQPSREEGGKVHRLCPFFQHLSPLLGHDGNMSRRWNLTVFNYVNSTDCSIRFVSLTAAIQRTTVIHRDPREGQTNHGTIMSITAAQGLCCGRVSAPPPPSPSSPMVTEIQIVPYHAQKQNLTSPSPRSGMSRSTWRLRRRGGVGGGGHPPTSVHQQVGKPSLKDTSSPLLEQFSTIAASLLLPRLQK